MSFEELLNRCYRHANDYYDCLIYGRKLVNTKISTYEQLINQIFERTGELYGISLSKKYSYLLARCLYIQLRGDHIITRWQKDNSQAIDSLLVSIRQNLEKESTVAARITGAVKQSLDIEPDSLNQLLLLLNIRSQNQQIRFASTAGIILSHGYSTVCAVGLCDSHQTTVLQRDYAAIVAGLEYCLATGKIPHDTRHIQRFMIFRHCGQWHYTQRRRNDDIV